MSYAHSERDVRYRPAHYSCTNLGSFHALNTGCLRSSIIIDGSVAPKDSKRFAAIMANNDKARFKEMRSRLDNICLSCKRLIFDRTAAFDVARDEVRLVYTAVCEIAKDNPHLNFRCEKLEARGELGQSRHFNDRPRGSEVRAEDTEVKRMNKERAEAEKLEKEELGRIAQMSDSFNSW